MHNREETIVALDGPGTSTLQVNETTSSSNEIVLQNAVTLDQDKRFLAGPLVSQMISRSLSDLRLIHGRTITMVNISDSAR